LRQEEQHQRYESRRDLHAWQNARGEGNGSGRENLMGEQGFSQGRRVGGLLPADEEQEQAERE
jgi:hypothetical protein